MLDFLLKHKENKSQEDKIIKNIEKDNKKDVKNQEYYNELLEENNKLLMQIIRTMED